MTNLQKCINKEILMKGVKEIASINNVFLEKFMRYKKDLTAEIYKKIKVIILCIPPFQNYFCV